MTFYFSCCKSKQFSHIEEEGIKNDPVDINYAR